MSQRVRPCFSPKMVSQGVACGGGAKEGLESSDARSCASSGPWEISFVQLQLDFELLEEPRVCWGYNSWSETYRLGQREVLLPKPHLRQENDTDVSFFDDPGLLDCSPFLILRCNPYFLSGRLPPWCGSLAPISVVITTDKTSHLLSQSGVTRGPSRHHWWRTQIPKTTLGHRWHLVRQGLFVVGLLFSIMPHPFWVCASLLPATAVPASSARCTDALWHRWGPPTHRHLL